MDNLQLSSLELAHDPRYVEYIQYFNRTVNARRRRAFIEGLLELIACLHRDPRQRSTIYRPEIRVANARPYHRTV